MPHDSFDDPFADLYGKLPDPRVSGNGHRAAPEEPHDTPTGAAPVSRRAAREAAARDAASRGTSSPAEDAAPGGSAESAPRSASERPAAPPRPAPPARPAAPRAGAERSDEAWPFADADTAPSTSAAYGRAASAGGGTATATRPSTLEDLFAGESSTDELGALPPEPDRGRRRIGAWIALAIVLLMVGGIAAGGLWVWNTYENQIREVMGWEEPKDYEEGLASGEALLTISSGDVPSTISRSLYDAGVTKTPEAFYEMLIDTGENPTFYPGVYQLQQRMTAAAALEALQDPSRKLENSALVREGLTVAQTLPILAEGLGMPLEEFEAAAADPAAYGVDADSLEGWLFPAMYTFDPGLTPSDVIQRMVDRTARSLDDAGVPEADRQRVLTIASIIQREARFEEDFYKVARVIENRMDPDNQETFGMLQMDSTAQYGYGEMNAGSTSTSAEAQYDDNPWNTYVHPGLPIGPISNPGDTAIDAAMNPADGDWLYFVTVNLDTGETLFTSNLADHNRGVAQWQAWCADNPDSGC
ncbi:endolytic transglycosylase MltG [Microbacterium sp. ARD31]|uniref:endolytic transglycosylase MltG n=1 Tax=Microbacterium sp. ARD31 TaxID=2962576 RepID=UPI0028813BD1|nr:endolytic transglycosylase MltG [Microbacterium sp. ARD31]MDT0181329.1 endolytic transglycosylase MltG [Microbacterium sp. ARD31]